MRRALIVIVIALLLVGGFYWFILKEDRPWPGQARGEIKHLHEAVYLFQDYFKCKLPSQIRLSSKLADMDEESLAVLRQMFPQRGFWTTWEREDMMWNDQATGPTTLEGDQCLVFFLGGPQRDNRPIGWSSDPRNPTKREPPWGDAPIMFFDFSPERLRARSGQAYLSFYDPYQQQPYAFFSDSLSRNSHCQSLGLLPYGPRADDVYQIISAGRDGRYGTKGDVWSPSNAAQTYPPESDGADDRANFHGMNLLGAECRPSQSALTVLAGSAMLLVDRHNPNDRLSDFAYLL